MKEITSIKLGKIQIVTDQVWNNLIIRGWDKKYTMVEVQERKLVNVPKIEKPIEVNTKTKKKI